MNVTIFMVHPRYSTVYNDKIRSAPISPDILDALSIHMSRSHVSSSPVFQVASPGLKMMKTRSPVGRGFLLVPGQPARVSSIPHDGQTPGSAPFPALQPALPLPSPAGTQQRPPCPAFPIRFTTSDPRPSSSQTLALL